MFTKFFRLLTYLLISYESNIIIVCFEFKQTNFGIFHILIVC